jgi:hypothetical protein
VDEETTDLVKRIATDVRTLLTLPADQRKALVAALQSYSPSTPRVLQDEAEELASVVGTETRLVLAGVRLTSLNVERDLEDILQSVGAELGAGERTQGLDLLRTLIASGKDLSERFQRVEAVCIAMPTLESWDISCDLRRVRVPGADAAPAYVPVSILSLTLDEVQERLTFQCTVDGLRRFGRAIERALIDLEGLQAMAKTARPKRSAPPVAGS